MITTPPDYEKPPINPDTKRFSSVWRAWFDSIYESAVNTSDVGVTVQAYDADLTVIAGLADPNADRVLFWDDSAGSYAYLTIGSGLTLTGTTLTGTSSPSEIDSATSSVATKFYLSEATSNGTNKVSLTAPTSLATDVTVTLPSSTGTLALTSDVPTITASRAAVSDVSGALTASTTTATEIGYVNGVTSAIQTQLNAKAASSHTHTLSNVTDAGTIASQNANNVSISGGSISGITDLAILDGGTGASDASGARTNLGLVIGTNVQAYDEELAALASLTSAADKGIQFTGVGTAATYDLTTAGKALLDDVDAAAQRTTLGLGTAATHASSDYLLAANNLSDVTAATARTNLGLVIGTNVQAYDADLSALAGVTSAADALPYFTGSGTASVTTMTSTARSLLDDTSTSAMRTTLGLAIGTDVQAYIATSEITGTSQTMAVNTKYIANNAAMVTLTLPASAALGDTFYIRGKGAGLFTVAVGSGQTIYFGNDSCTASTGTWISTHRRDSITIECTTANTEFMVSGSQGNFTKT